MRRRGKLLARNNALFLSSLFYLKKKFFSYFTSTITAHLCSEYSDRVNASKSGVQKLLIQLLSSTSAEAKKSALSALCLLLSEFSARGEMDTLDGMLPKKERGGKNEKVFVNVVYVSLSLAFAFQTFFIFLHFISS